MSRTTIARWWRNQWSLLTAVIRYRAISRSARPQYQKEITQPQRISVALEIENLPIERRNARDVADGQSDPATHRTRVRNRHEKRLLMMSPTRSALAMMVSVGFTAPLETKKLASTT